MYTSRTPSILESKSKRLGDTPILMRHMCTINTCCCGGICESMKQRMNECLDVTKTLALHLLLVLCTIPMRKFNGEKETFFVLWCCAVIVRICALAVTSVNSSSGSGGDGLVGILLNDNYDNDCVLSVIQMFIPEKVAPKNNVENCA
uniref:Uncharacterized protein n=1 Tax=Glossina brevipalpis TaxID=37001 RepID=A0A1A9WEE0_9MUSC